MMRDALGQTPRVDKDERRTMLRGQRGDAIVDFAPHFVGSDGTKLASGNLDGQIEFTPVADLHDDRIWLGRAAEKMSDEFDRLLRRGKTNPRKSFAGQVVETFERKRKVRAAFVVGDGVNLIDDDGFHGSEDLAAFCGSQQDVQGFWSRNQNVRGTGQHRAALVRQRISRANGCAYLRHEDAALRGKL